MTEESKIVLIGIDLGEPKTMQEVADALKLIAKDIEDGYYSGVAGWSDVSWGIEEEQE